MTISVGTRLGPYEILSPLGAGGMGEVYRARDTRLGRDVALKVIHSRLATDPERLSRFEKEARAAAQLDHPNILILHDIGSHEGSPFVVSELLEGESLREKLGEPLPPKKAVEYALQVAHGLAAAHEKGIVHRDIKPENVFVTKDGHVKILDFGLAKLIQPAIPSVSLTEALTAAPTTDANVIMGTVGYMSPEQVMGKPLDARSDLFSLGVVLYETLSGKRPFQKDTAAETMAAILKEEPPELSGTDKPVPSSLDRIVRHCLEKSAERRFQSARDLAFDLESLSQTTTGGTAPIRAPRGKRWLAIVALGIALLVAFGAGFFKGGEKADRAPMPSFKRLTFKRGTVTGARFAPDGRTVVYSAAWDGLPSAVYSIRLDALDPVPSGYAGANLLAVSSKSQLALSLQSGISNAWIPRGTLALAPFAGGTPRELDPDVGSADFSGDGEKLAIVRGTFNMRLEYPSGTLLYSSPGFSSRGVGAYLSHVRISPSGEYVAFLDHTTPGTDSGFVVVVDRLGKTILRKGPFNTLQGLAWSPRGDEVWFGGDPAGDCPNLRATTLGGSEHILLAAPIPMLPLDVAPDGRVLAATYEARIRLFYRDAASRERELSTQGNSTVGAISPDGAWVAIGDDWNGVTQSYLRSSSGAPPVSLGPGHPANFSPDGRTLVVVQRPEGTRREGAAVVLHPLGPGHPTAIRLDGFELGNPYRGAGLLPDGKTIWFIGNQPSRPVRTWEAAVSGGKPRPLTPEGVSGQVTADGTSVVFWRDGKQWIQPITGGEARLVGGLLEGEFVAAWTADGKPLFVFRNRECPARIYRLDPKTGRREFFREIAPPDSTGVQMVFPMMTPDGKACAYQVVQWLSELHLIEGLK
jgi:eukaryotic-like serine/threonine-protein kinase